MNEIKMSQLENKINLLKICEFLKTHFVVGKKNLDFPSMRKIYTPKQRNLKISESDIANILNISRRTLYGWKKKFVNSVDENSLPDYADNEITKCYCSTSEHPMSSSDDKLWSWNYAKKKRTERTEVEHSV
uniref:Helix-turn-helix domain-containing protein n=1 Tax=Globodera rostochiensis TaxID=31243 RepID=A0A914H933_GLORO